MKILSPLLLLPLVIFNSGGCGAVLRLHDGNYEKLTAGKSIFVRVIDPPRCQSCDELTPDWERLAADWEGHPHGMVAQIDCSNDDSGSLCEDHDFYHYLGFAFMYGEPDKPLPYEGEVGYESLAAFAKEKLSDPVCSVYAVEHCSEEEKALIQSFMSKPEEELQQLRANVEAELDEAHEAFNRDIKTVNAQYEALAERFSSHVDQIIKKHEYKHVRQLLIKNEVEQIEKSK